MPLQLTPLDVSHLSPVVAKMVGPTAQGPARMMAARGMVPMGPRDLVTALYQLSLDPEPKLVEVAKGTAEGLPDNILGAALGEALDPRILHYYSLMVLDRPQLVEKVLLNRATHDDTFVALAGRLSEREVELLATNQERILGCPAIIEALYFNKQARMSTIERLLEMAVRNGINLDRIPGFKEIAASILGGGGKKRNAAEAAEMDEAFAAAATDEGPVGDMELDEDGLQKETKKKRISEMTVMEKHRLATIGSPGVRSLLVRDANRSVAMAAISSPAVSDQEAARYAANRALNEEIVRYIASRKDWQRNYQLKVALINNPKCPLSSSMHLLIHLRPNDLRALQRSKNIPSALAQAAKEMMRKKNV